MTLFCLSELVCNGLWFCRTFRLYHKRLITGQGPEKKQRLSAQPQMGHLHRAFRGSGNVQERGRQERTEDGMDAVKCCLPGMAYLSRSCGYLCKTRTRPGLSAFPVDAGVAHGASPHPKQLLVVDGF